MADGPVTAALDGGAYYHHEALRGDRFCRYFDQLIYAPRLQRHRLDDIDTLIVTCRTNSVLLGQEAPLLRAFLDRGQTLVVMGECRVHEWLPEVRWQPGTSNYWWWLDPEATLGLTMAAPAHGLFDHITVGDATWHYHGVFPGDGRAVIGCPRDGGAILIDDDKTWNGRLIATTLDPFYHHGSFFMPAATRFLTGFLPWLRSGAPGWPDGARG